MKTSRTSVALIAAWLLGGVAALTGMPVPSESATCMVTLVVTDANGKPDPDVPPRQRPCRSGEQNGGTEVYNPYTGGYGYYPPGSGTPFGGNDRDAGAPPTGSTPASSSVSSTTHSTTSGCTPAPHTTKPGIQTKQTAQTTHSQPTCSSSSTPATPTR